MTDTNQKLEDDVLRRMLATKPQPRKASGKRTEVKDAHDRYANVDLSYPDTGKPKKLGLTPMRTKKPHKPE